MEGLFMPIFYEVSKRTGIQFHVIQFAWANTKKIAEVRQAAQHKGILYTCFPVQRKPTAFIGSLITLFTAPNRIKKYMAQHHVDVLMPRSIFPAFMVLHLKNPGCPILFDADGLPAEERIDFAGLKKNSIMFRWLKNIETSMLRRADHVITRSHKAVDIHLKTLAKEYKDKFSVVINGRAADDFKPDLSLKAKIRHDLGIDDNEFVFVYCGSLGSKYGWTEMLEIFSRYQENRPARLLILTGQPDFVQRNCPELLKEKIITRTVSARDVPYYLRAANVAFCLIVPAYSMQAAAATKLGEYLLSGLPVIANKGIGDTDTILKNYEGCFLYNYSLSFEQQYVAVKKFLDKTCHYNSEDIRQQAVSRFSLESAAESYITALNKLMH